MSADAELLGAAIEYFPDTGLFRWKISPAQNVFAGSVAGSFDNKGYWRIKYKERAYRAHRIAWLLMTGEWPTEQIDHRNLVKSDNRWCNLREATNSQNKANSKGLGRFPKGVYLHQRGKFGARIKSNGKERHLGYFQTAEEAAAAYAAAAKEYFGEFARTA